jgi:hypothetical protein
MLNSLSTEKENMYYALLSGLVLIGCSTDSGPEIETMVFPEAKTLSVPWFHQLDIPEVGWAACSSATSAMVLAYHGFIYSDQQSMVAAAEVIFSATSDPERGLLARDGLAGFLMEEWALTTVDFTYAPLAELYDIIRTEISADRPLILGTRSINSYGHYMVITGYEGNHYEDASIILNDPYGLWEAHDQWCSDCLGKGVAQDFTAFLANENTDGIFILLP